MSSGPNAELLVNHHKRSVLELPLLFCGLAAEDQSIDCLLIVLMAELTTAKQLWLAINSLRCARIWIDEACHAVDFAVFAHFDVRRQIKALNYFIDACILFAEVSLLILLNKTLELIEKCLRVEN